MPVQLVGAISSSSILRPILNKTYYSMYGLFTAHRRQQLHTSPIYFYNNMYYNINSSRVGDCGTLRPEHAHTVRGLWQLERLPSAREVPRQVLHIQRRHSGQYKMVLLQSDLGTQKLVKAKVDGAAEVL